MEAHDGSDRVTFTVGEVAQFAGTTVRTLHHYDELGLLSPSGRTEAGYRSYGEADLQHLQRVLCYRQLGFGLEEIRTILDESLDPLDHLRRQHALLTGQAERLQRMVASLEKAMEARQMGIQLDPHEMFEVFGDFDPTEHAEEARDRWGDTDAYRESQRRTSSYSKADWLQIKAAGEEIERQFAAAQAAGLAPDSPEATAAAEAHRAHISRWFYECGYPMHLGLAEMYVTDPRFAAHYDDISPGLSAYVHDAIAANASGKD